MNNNSDKNEKNYKLITKENEITQNNNIKKHLYKGLFAGIASSTSILSYPLEVIKIRLQVIESSFNNNQFFQTKKIILNMYKHEGLKSFYKGFSQNILHGFIGYGSVFFFYNLIYNIKSNLQSYPVINSIISSTIAGCIAVTLTTPFQFIKTRLVLYKNKDSKLVINSLIKDIYNEKKSIIAFWKAMNPSLITSLYSAIQISMYEILKKIFDQNQDEKLLLGAGVLGMFSRCIAATVVFPFALIRSRMMNFNMDNIKDDKYFYKSSYKYRKTIFSIREIIGREGVLSLFRGLRYELVKVAINGALFFYAYEYLNKRYVVV